MRADYCFFQLPNAEHFKPWTRAMRREATNDPDEGRLRHGAADCGGPGIKLVEAAAHIPRIYKRQELTWQLSAITNRQVASWLGTLPSQAKNYYPNSQVSQVKLYSPGCIEHPKYTEQGR